MGKLETTIEFQSHSQIGQDKWVFDLIGDWGLFLDIGCGTPDFWSNTFGLEQVGWMGWLIDNSFEARDASVKRHAWFLFGNATQMTYSFLPNHVDYLSLDVNGSTLEVLKVLPLERVRFRCITIEHDAYRYGIERQDEMRFILSSYGYTLAIENVKHNDLAFEDWWVSDDAQ